MREILTARLRCRPLADGDRGLYVGLYADPEAMQWIGAPLSAHAAGRSFNAACRAQAADAPLDRYWAMTLRAGGSAIGLLALRRSGAAAGEAEIGAMLLREHRSLGYAAEAISALVGAASALPLQALYTRHHRDHGAAHALMRKLGFAKSRDPATGETRWRLACGTGGR